MKGFDTESGYHPAFGSPPRHDHHRRARRSFVTALVLVVMGAIARSWSTENYWGQRQRDIAAWLGVGLVVAGIALAVFAAYAWFAFDDDLHPDEPE